MCAISDATLPDDPVAIAADVDFPVALRGYDRVAVDAHVKRTSQLVAELQAARSPEAAIRRAIERTGEQISGILQRARDTAEQITAQSRAQAEDRLEVARQEAAQITAAGKQRLKDLDADTDRIWAERRRIVEDVRELSGQLIPLAKSATELFPPAEPDETAEPEAAEPDVGAEPHLVAVGGGRRPCGRPQSNGGAPTGRNRLGTLRTPRRRKSPPRRGDRPNALDRPHAPRT